ncbi:MAG: T9SS type A sorting domain-containing protein, partial [Flavobacteriaceae bacterium]
IALHPNPMTNVLHISYISTTTVNYTLYDSTGKQLSSQTHTGKEHQLEVSHLASGTYLLKANNDTQFKNYRFMKE